MQHSVYFNLIGLINAPVEFRPPGGAGVTVEQQKTNLCDITG